VFIDGIASAGTFEPIAESKYVMAPLYHSLGAIAALVFGDARAGVFLSMGVLVPLSALFIYVTARLFVDTRWALFATALYAFGVLLYAGLRVEDLLDVGRWRFFDHVLVDLHRSLGVVNVYQGLFTHHHYLLKGVYGRLQLYIQLFPLARLQPGAGNYLLPITDIGKFHLVFPRTDTGDLVLTICICGSTKIGARQVHVYTGQGFTRLAVFYHAKDGGFVLAKGSGKGGKK
jgi:hypothetical protein